MEQQLADRATLNTAGVPRSQALDSKDGAGYPHIMSEKDLSMINVS